MTNTPFFGISADATFPFVIVLIHISRQQLRMDDFYWRSFQIGRPWVAMQQRASSYCCQPSIGRCGPFRGVVLSRLFSFLRITGKPVADPCLTDVANAMSIDIQAYCCFDHADKKTAFALEVPYNPMYHPARKYKNPPATLRPVNYATAYAPASSQVIQAHKRPATTQRTTGMRSGSLWIPPEVIAEIVSFIWDEPTLASCVRTAKAFLQPAQKNLFCKVVLSFPSRSGFNTWRTPRKLYELLKVSPHISKYIQTLDVHVGVDHKLEDDESRYSQGDERERIYLHRLVPRLTNLRALSFPRFGPSNRNHASRWTTTPFFPALTEEQWRNLIALDIAALSEFQFPSFTILSRLGGLQKLTMDCVLQLDNHRLAAHWKHPLKTLEVVGYFDINVAVCLFLSPAFPFDLGQRLTRLTIDQSDQQFVHLDEPHRPRDLRRLTELLRLCKNIREFRIRPCCEFSSLMAQFQLILTASTLFPASAEYSFNGYRMVFPYNPVAAPPDISDLLGLETVILEGIVEAVNNRIITPTGQKRQPFVAACPIQWMVDLFRTVPRTSQLRIKEVRLIFIVAFMHSIPLLRVLYQQWDGLCDVLMSERFPWLRKVHISISTGINSEKLREFRDTEAYTGLKKMQRAGILKFDI